MLQDSAVVESGPENTIKGNAEQDIVLEGPALLVL
jgi:hypothetical protein